MFVAHVLVLSGFAAPAAAGDNAATDTREAAPSSYVLRLEPALGIGAPTGWLGAAAVVHPTTHFALHAGAGLGSQGVQVAAGGRVRFATAQRDYVAVGIGWSMGPFAGVASETSPWFPDFGRRRPTTLVWERAHFANLDVSLEHEFTRVAVRPFFGFGFVVNGDDATLVNPRGGSTWRGRVLPYLGFAISFGVL